MIKSEKLLYLLAGVLAGYLVSVGHRTYESRKPSSLTGEGLPEFDSFSKPSMAAAILEQEAGRLFSACNEQQWRRAADELRPGSVQGPRRASSTRQRGPDQGSSIEGGTVPALQTTAIQPLARLGQETQALSLDLDGKLMKVYYQNQLWDNYLDCYLRVLRGAPDGPIARLSARCALLASEKCGRTEEVLDAMRHVARFHRRVETARSLSAAVEEWGINRSRSLEGDHDGRTHDTPPLVPDRIDR